MRPVLKTIPTACIALLGGFASLVLPTPADASQVVPPFVYASGAQGVGYYQRPQAAQAPRQVATRPQAAPARTVGPGTRDWSTGRRGRLHKPWLNSR